MDIWNVSVLRKGRRYSERIGALFKAKGLRSYIVSARRFVKQESQPRQSNAQFVDRGGADRFCVADVRNLGAAGEVASEARQKNVRYALTILVEEVITGEQSEMRVVVDTSAGLVVAKPNRCRLVGKFSISRIRRRDKLQQVLRRHAECRSWNLRTRKYARRSVGAASGVVRLARRYRISQSGRELLRPRWTLYDSRQRTCHSGKVSTTLSGCRDWNEACPAALALNNAVALVIGKEEELIFY